MSQTGKLALLPGTAEGAARAAAALRRGAVVAIPTDTVYGLAAAVDQPRAIDRLYDIKERSRAKPIPVLLADPSDAAQVCPVLPPLASTLAARFWPGALTLVVPAVSGLHPAIIDAAAETGPTVAIRVPHHKLAREVIRLAGGVLAVTSANRSGDLPAVEPSEITTLQTDLPDAILDGGPAPGGVASTVVLATGSEVMILREGAISRAEIDAALEASRLANAADRVTGASRV